MENVIVSRKARELLWLERRRNPSVADTSVILSGQNERTLITPWKHCRLSPGGNGGDRTALFLGGCVFHSSVVTTGAGVRLQNCEQDCNKHHPFLPLCRKNSPLRSPQKLNSPFSHTGVLAGTKQAVAGNPRFRGGSW